MISRLILLFKSLPSSSSSVKSTFGLRSEHPTKIRGHPEGESALGASVACRKAARWCQPDVDILYFQSIVKFFRGGCPMPISVYGFESMFDKTFVRRGVQMAKD